MSDSEFDNEFDIPSEATTVKAEVNARYSQSGRTVDAKGNPDVTSCTACVREELECQPAAGAGGSCTHCVEMGQTKSCNRDGLIPKFEGPLAIPCSMWYVGEVRKEGLGVWIGSSDPLEKAKTKDGDDLLASIEGHRAGGHLPPPFNAATTEAEEIPFAELEQVVEWAAARQQSVPNYSSYFLPRLRLDKDWKRAREDEVKAKREADAKAKEEQEADAKAKEEQEAKTEGEEEEEDDVPPQPTSPIQPSTQTTTEED